MQKQSFDITEFASELFRIAGEYVKEQRDEAERQKRGTKVVVPQQPVLVDSPPTSKRPSPKPTLRASNLSLIAPLPAAIRLTGVPAQQEGQVPARAASAVAPRPTAEQPIHRSSSAASDLRPITLSTTARAHEVVIAPEAGTTRPQEAPTSPYAIDSPHGMYDVDAGNNKSASLLRGFGLGDATETDAVSVKSFRCNVCSSEVEEAAKFCSECGAKVAQAIDDDFTPRTSHSALASSHTTPPPSKLALLSPAAKGSSPSMQEGAFPDHGQSRESSGASSFSSPLAQKQNPFSNDGSEEDQSVHDVPNPFDRPSSSRSGTEATFYSAHSSPHADSHGGQQHDVAQLEDDEYNEDYEDVYDDDDDEEGEGVRL